MCAHESEDSLTNMQRHVLHYILFQSLQHDIYQKDLEKEFQIRRSQQAERFSFWRKTDSSAGKRWSGMRG